MSSHILPAIIPTSAVALQEVLETLQFASRIQIDVVDGTFAAPASWPYDPVGDVSIIRPWLAPYQVVVDIMAKDAIFATQHWIEAGASAVVIHLESIASLEPIIALQKEKPFSLYLSADDDQSPHVFVPYFDVIDGVQLMGIDTVGQQGQPFSSKVLDNIRLLRSLHLTLPIIIDGSVNQTTLPLLHEAGATDFVVGSAIVQQADPQAAYASLVALLNK